MRAVSPDAPAPMTSNSKIDESNITETSAIKPLCGSCRDLVIYDKEILRYGVSVAGGGGEGE